MNTDGVSLLAPSPILLADPAGLGSCEENVWPSRVVVLGAQMVGCWNPTCVLCLDWLFNNEPVSFLSCRKVGSSTQDLAFEACTPKQCQFFILGLIDINCKLDKIIELSKFDYLSE